MAENDPWAEFRAVNAQAPAEHDPWAEFRSEAPEVKAVDIRDKSPHPESSTLFGNAKAETWLGELGAGIQQGVRQVVSTAPALASFGVRKVEDWTGADTHGLDEALMQTSSDIASGGAQRGIASIEQLKLMDPSTWLRYTAGTIGETVPFIAAIMSGAGAADMLAGMLAKKGVQAATRSAIINSIPASTAGAVATAAGIESAATGQELWDSQKDIYTGASLLAGSAKGALESVFPLMLGKSLGLTGNQATHLLDRIYQGSGRLGKLGVGAATEGGTEALQEEADIITRSYIDENYGYLSPEANSRRLNSLVAGGIGGGFFSLYHGSHPDEALKDSDVRKAAGDVPYLTGQGPDELPTTGPEAAIDASLPGLDATVGVANIAELDALQGTVDIRRRGLFAAAIPGTELTFGSQDQALNDGANAKVTSYLRLDPDKVNRGDISVSVEDLPSSIADSRVDFLDQNTLKEAANNLVEAIKWRDKGKTGTTPQARENALAKAAVFYRQAMDNGARVEPFPDSQIVLRDPKKHTQLMEAQASSDLSSMRSKAELKETRTRDNGKSFFVLSRLSGEDEGRGKTIDLERVRPGDVTAFPTQDLSRQVQADQQISRKLDVGRAKAKGIRFEGVTDVPTQKNLLKEFVQFLQGTGRVSKGFQKFPKASVERFMSLVDRGLRLDVTADTPNFALLRKLAPNGFAEGIEITEPSAGKDKDLQKIIRSRSKRTGEPRVAKRIIFQTPAVQKAFMSQFHNTSVRRILAGLKGMGTGGTDVPGISPIGDMIRDIFKSMAIRTDVAVEIVAPGSLNGRGTLYDEKSVVLKENGQPQPRSVIQVDPWFYARQTAGQKPLIKRPEGEKQFFVSKREPGQKRGDAYRIQPVIKLSGLKDSSLKNMSRADFDATYPGATHLIEKQGKGGVWEFQEAGGFEDLTNKMEDEVTAGNLARSDNLVGQDTLAYTKAEKGDTVPPPVVKLNLSAAGKAAQSLGVPTTKMFTEDERVAEFVTDVAHEASKIIASYEWERMGTPQQELFKVAYRRERHASQGQNKATQLARVVAHPILERTIGEQRGRHRAAYNFEEWLVSNITRWMVQPHTPVGPVEKFFRTTAGKIKDFIDGIITRIKNKEAPYRNDLNLGRPEFIVQEWLEKLMQRGKVTQEEPFLSEPTRRALNDSIARNVKNAKTLGLDESVTMFPERASTFRVKQLLKIFPKDAHADRAKIKGLLAVADRHNTMMEWILGIHQMADLNPHIAGLQAYKSLNRAMENTALSWASLADSRVREVHALGKAQSDALFKLLFELDQMTYLTAKQKEDHETRWPTEQELLTLVKKHGLQKAAFDAYVNIRQDFLQFLSYLEEVSTQKAIETIQDPLELAKEVKSISGEVAQMKARPYFPHMRFGKYVVTVRNNKGEVLHFEAFSSKKERDGAVVAIEKTYKVPADNSIVEDELSPTLQQWQGLPAFALRNIESALGLDKPDLTAQQKKDKKLLEALALQAAPTTSFRRQLLERANTPGFSADGLRAYGTYFARAARFVARQEYTKRLEGAIKDVRNSGSPISQDARTRIADYMTRHYEELMKPSTDWAEMRAIGYLWYFAFVPATAFVNLTQVPMVAMPYLAAKFGDLTTMGKVTAAFRDVSKDYFNELRGVQPKDEGILSEAIEEAHESRLLDDGFAQELAAISQGSVLQRTLSTSKFGQGLRRLGQWGTAPFSLAEKFNRAVTFRAAYKMALADNNSAHVNEVMAGNQQEADQLRVDRGWDEPHLRAYMVAADAVRTTQFEYSRWARPKLMSGPRGVLLMFKSYLQNMLFFLFKQDRGVQVRMLLGLAATAGLMGLPGADDANELMKWLLRQFGMSFDFEKMIRTMMADWTEGNTGDIVLHGASRIGFGIPAALNGLGIPSATPDLSGSLSMGKLIPGLKGMINPDSSSWRETVGQVTSEVAGPWLGVPFNIYQSVMDHSLPADDVKRWERTFPRALRAMMKSSRLMAEQRERDRSGATVVSFDPNDMSDQMDIASVAAGFNPAKLSRQWDYSRAQMEVQRYWLGQRQILTQELFRAKRLKDKEGIEDAVKAIRGFNEEAPDKALRITNDTLKKSMQAQGRNLKFKEAGVPVNKAVRGVTGQVDRLYPEAVTRREKVPR